MRDLVQEILFGITGQSLVFEALEGRPSAITSVTIARAEVDDDGPVETTAVASSAVDSVNTTTSGAAGILQGDPTAIPLTSAAGVAEGRTYLLGSGANSEWIEVASISGSTVYARCALLNDYASGGVAFVSTRMTAAIASSWASDKSKISGEPSAVLLLANQPASDWDADPWYRVSWVYVVGGVSYRRESRFDLVRYSSGHTITPVDVDRRFPGWIDRLPVDYRRGQGQGLIDEAFREVKLDMLADGHATRWLRRGDVIAALTIARAQWIAAELAVIHGGGTADAVKVSEDGYRRRYDQLVGGSHVRIGTAPGGAVVGDRPISRLLSR